MYVPPLKTKPNKPVRPHVMSSSARRRLRLCSLPPRAEMQALFQTSIPTALLKMTLSDIDDEDAVNFRHFVWMKC